jgi:phenylacetate-coenzyme A ligase PaaK-like adenylate-forming protein
VGEFEVAISGGIWVAIGALATTVRNSYGASEFLSIAWECQQGRLHVNSDWLILEPVDERNRPTRAGEYSNSTLLTNLANTVQPLIRYDLGDQIIVQPQPCSCGSSLPVIEVTGRHDDSLKFDGLDGRSVTLLPLALTTVLEEQAGIFNFQLRQRDARTLELHLPSTCADVEATVLRCRKVLKEFAQRQGLANISVIGIFDSDSWRGRSGKIQRVVANTPH